ncbi:Kelch domain-containing protein 2 [Podila epigama]|nr:Kelch domain-containing protein 2 [Podila epigama]
MPLDRSSHTATIIRSNGLVVVIGGIAGGALVPMSEIHVYNTNTDKWSTQTATGALPPPRKNHVAAADITGQIYIHGGTDMSASTYLSDIAILDTTSWTWKQPAFEGNAPTGRYSHAATMVGSNLLITFGLTAGGATNTLSILDTTSNTWVSSYTPNNLARTSTKPEDWPGYKPPPALPQPPHPVDPKSPRGNSGPNLGPVLGTVFGVLALSVLLVYAVRRHRKKRMVFYKPQDSIFYLQDQYHDSRIEDAYRPTGMAFKSNPLSFRQRVSQFWSGMGSASFWKGNKSQRLHDQELEEEQSQDMYAAPMQSDQEIFLAAVHRARSRTGIMPPNFMPLQQPIVSSPPVSPRMPAFPAPAGLDPETSGLGQEEGDGDHGRAYSDGFENAMRDMDIQMLAVPRGRLFVVNPSLDQESTAQDGDNGYGHFDSEQNRHN